ncbi:TorF family putative porin [Methylopila sp. M107]|uniref:TorF family putative porin n=1 Tax=Methylopila sp. M107 TaxID=1101190 RepID=UPI00036AC691|nr:TorF family putative porin [Methylopila sp. M107]
MNGLSGLALKTLTGVALGAMIVGSASAADLASPEPVVAEVPSVIDVAFGVAGVTDYVFRGLSQTHGDPAVQGYAELQAYGFYAGVWGSSVSDFVTDPSAEVDFYGGYRGTFSFLSVDVGGLYYYYPGEFTPAGTKQLDYWELYAKPAVALGDWGSITGNLYWTSDYVNVSGDGTYLSVIPKVNIPLSSFPDLGFYVSGEFGKQWVKGEKLFGLRGFLPDYLTWNIGAGVTYKAMTLDVRYSDTDLKPTECAGYTGFRKSCDERVMVKLSFDTALSKLK